MRNWGSSAHLVLTVPAGVSDDGQPCTEFALSGAEDALAQQIELGTAVHRALDQLETIDLLSTGSLLRGSAIAARIAS